MYYTCTLTIFLNSVKSKTIECNYIWSLSNRRRGTTWERLKINHAQLSLQSTIRDLNHKEYKDSYKDEYEKIIKPNKALVYGKLSSPIIKPVGPVICRGRDTVSKSTESGIIPHCIKSE